MTKLSMCATSKLTEAKYITSLSCPLHPSLFYCLCVCLSWPVFLSVSLAAPFFLLALSVPCLGSSVPSDVFIAIHRHLCFSTPPPLNQILPPYGFPSSTRWLKLCPLSCQVVPSVQWILCVSAWFWGGWGGGLCGVTSGQGDLVWRCVRDALELGKITMVQ